MTSRPPAGQRAAMGRRLRLVSGFAGATALAQALAMVAGFVVVRALDVHSYALYSITTAAVAAGAVLSDSGINSTLIARAGAAVAAGQPVAPHVATAGRARRRLLAWVLPALMLPTAYLLLRNGASVGDTAAFILAAVLILAPDVTSNLLKIVLQVDKRVRTLQWLAVGVALARVVILGALALSPIEWAPAFALGAALVSGGQLLVVRRLSAPALAVDAAPEDPAPYRRALRHTLPETITLAVASQLLNLTLTFAGNTRGIAEIAALGRYTLAFAVVNAVIANIVAPTIARGEVTRRSSLRALARVASVYLLFSCAFVAAVAIFHEPLLWLLGPDYTGLATALVVVSAGSALSFFSRYGIGGVNYARGWTAYGWTYAPFLALAWTGAALAVDLSTAIGAAWLASSQALAVLASQALRFWVGFRALPRGPGSAQQRGRDAGRGTPGAG